MSFYKNDLDLGAFSSSMVTWMTVVGLSLSDGVERLKSGWQLHDDVNKTWTNWRECRVNSPHCHLQAG